jgi:hypothetical protein
VAHIAICATSHKKYAPLRFEKLKNSKKKLKIEKKTIFFENRKNQNNVKKLSNHTEFLDFSLGHPSLDYSGLSTLNFSILFA